MKKLIPLLLGLLCAAALRLLFPALRAGCGADRELLQSVGSYIARQEDFFVR